MASSPPTTPPYMAELKPFEDDMVDMIKYVEMKHSDNPLQKQMREDIRKIKNITEVIVQADKTANLYLIKTEDYNKYLMDTTSKEYKKTDPSTMDRINGDAAKTAKKLKLDDRIESMDKKNAYLTIKDHKPDFPARLNFRLINPCKTNMGKISKAILDRVNNDVKAATGLKQWKSTGEVLTWFKGLERKNRMKWLKFDIESYYPSISMDLLRKSLDFAKGFTIISPEEEEIIMHCRKTVLVGKDDTLWIKKDNPEFDVSMGSLDSAEVSDTVGLYLLSKMEDIIPEGRVGLYRDDGLSIIEGNGQEVERIRKKLTKLFQDEGLKITTEGNITVVDFLDVVLDLNNIAYKPFIKPNASTKYVSLHSSHPPAILANIPDAICKRLSSISSSKEMFEEEVEHYRQALQEAGYNNTLEYMEEIEAQEEMVMSDRKKRRTRDVIWFNPPYSNNVKTNVGKRFLTLLRKHFPPSSDMYKLFNTKKVKLSYSCCPSMKSIISSHNTKLIRAKGTMQTYGCNCRGGVESCPLQGRCQVPSLVYKATVSSVEGDRSYIGQAASTFKLRYNNHMNSFTNTAKKHSTALSTYVWKLNREGVDHNIRWSSQCEPQPYNGGGRICDLCVMEKTMIARSDVRESLNKRTEIMAKCRHKLPYYLNNYHGLQLPHLTHQPVLHPPEQDPPDLEEPDREPPDQATSTPTQRIFHHPAEEMISLPQPQIRGPMTRSRARHRQ